MPDTILRGGDKLQRRLGELGAKVKKAATVRIGFLEKAKYPNGTSVAMVAAIQEFGAPKVGIQPRPFFRNMIAKEKGGWGNVVAAQLQRTDYDAALTLDRLGALIAGQLRESITEGTYAPLSEVTLMVRQIIGPNGTATFADVLEARRRIAAGEKPSGVSTKPLVWTGHMLNSIDHEVS